MKTIQYSEKERISKQEGIYQHYYDKFDENEYKEAYVVLFIGRVGDGKTNAINAFFNIVKGIKLEEKFRYILIEEPEKKEGQNVSQTTGIHLHYIKDYNNKPIIIIDSEGYANAKGYFEDIYITKSFCYVFSNLIDHINAVCFTAKGIYNRLDNLTKYIFNCVTNLFSEDINGNFIILCSFANMDTIQEGPKYIETMEYNEDFLNIKKRMGEKYWYAFDSRCLLDDDEIYQLTKYSYEQMYKLYEDKIKKLTPKTIKESIDIINSRESLKLQANDLWATFKELFNEENSKEKDNINNKMKIKIMKLQALYNKIKEKGLNKNQIKVEIEYIDYLISLKLEEDLRDREGIEILKDVNKINNLIKNIVKIPEEELLNINANDFIKNYAKYF